jgi:hypothetical protein
MEGNGGVFRLSVNSRRPYNGGAYRCVLPSQLKVHLENKERQKAQAAE